MSEIDYDVIVAGAGVAGCMTAKRLIDAGLDVLVLERSKDVKVDSGIVSKHFSALLEGEAKQFIRKEIDTMELVGSNGVACTISSEEPFAYLIDREGFGKWLRRGVRKNISYEQVSGANILEDCAVVNTDSNIYRCKLVVGADGALSKVRKSLGIRPPFMRWGFVLRGTPRDGHIRVWFDKNISKDGFGWEIPEAGEIGLLAGERSGSTFREFCNQREICAGRVFGGPIPLGTCRSYTDRALLVGDAAGQVKPLTGGGIIFGMRASAIAAASILTAFGQKRFDAQMLRCYEKGWKKEIGGEITREMIIWKLYRNAKNTHINWFMKLLGRDIYVKRLDYDSLFNSLLRLVTRFNT